VTRILAFDTSGPHCTVALRIDGKIVAHDFKEMSRGQSESLFPMIESVLAQEGAVLAELDAIGVGTGPGNFTGIRISVSAARGLALSLGVPAVGVSSFDALRRMACAEGHRSLAVLPAPRDQWLWEFSSGEGAPDIKGIAEKRVFERHEHVTAPGLIGTWSEGMEQEASTVLNGLRIPDVAAGTSFPDFAENVAALIAEIASERWQDADLERPAPVYVRPPDAAPSSDKPPVILP